MLCRSQCRAAAAGDAMTCRLFARSLLAAAEQHTHAWQPPKFLDTVDGAPVPPGR